MRFQSTRPLRGATTSALYLDISAVFQSTRPLRGATEDAINPRSNGTFQSTRPLRGATAQLAHRVPRRRHFNPRAPCGARRSGHEHSGNTMRISIHAPLAGRDTLRVHALPLLADISIHAPLAGRDDSARAMSYDEPNFNPRAPCGARPPAGRCCFRRSYFNPRAPCGARPAGSRARSSRLRFQSTRPLRGATSAASYTGACSCYFNPRAPCGARLQRHTRSTDRRDFNPRAPCGARLVRLVKRYCVV